MMLKLLVCCLLVQSLFLSAQSRKSKIKLVQYLPYCGGANTTKNLKHTPNKSVVYGNKKLIFISQDQTVDTLTTDKSGYLKLKLPYGTYLVYEPWKYYHSLPKGFLPASINMNCLKDEWLKEDLKIVISKKTITVANNIILLKCPNEFPCLVIPNSKQ